MTNTPPTDEQITIWAAEQMGYVFDEEWGLCRSRRKALVFFDPLACADDAVALAEKYCEGMEPRHGLCMFLYRAIRNMNLDNSDDFARALTLAVYAACKETNDGK